MREIKFRYVFKRKDDGRIYMIITSIDAIEEGNEHLLAMLKNEEWKTIGKDLYTGLKDKNGREIYEGDIIYDAMFNLRGIVKFRDGCFVVEWIDYFNEYMDSEDLASLITLNEKYVEIIGNIYENPELLEEG